MGAEHPVPLLAPVGWASAGLSAAIFRTVSYRAKVRSRQSAMSRAEMSARLSSVRVQAASFRHIPSVALFPDRGKPGSATRTRSPVTPGGARRRRLRWLHDRERVSRGAGSAPSRCWWPRLMSGCSGDGKGAPAWTARSPAASTTAAGAPGARHRRRDSAPRQAATGAVRRRPARRRRHGKSFPIPPRTSASSCRRTGSPSRCTPDQGTLPGALKIEVKDAEGTYLATLQTGLPPPPLPACADDAARKPYVVVSSVPVDLPHRGGEGTIAPHVVFRVIQGYRFFGSYGITNWWAAPTARPASCRTWSAARQARGTTPSAT